MRKEFIEAIENHQAAFGLNLAEEKILALAGYYEIIQKHNEILHLVAPAAAEEFATRHVLESLTALEFLPKNAKFADVGAGAGLPSIPCLIAREDLSGFLIESKLKKAKFLEEALSSCNLKARAEILNRQFEELQKPSAAYVLCRALDKFTQKLQRPPPEIKIFRPTCALCSTTKTRRPRFPASAAQKSPAAPAPMTIASNFIAPDSVSSKRLSDV
jgi:16S rRNA (guanine(527)-N(7))-methyltransferase RsmG